MECRVVYSTFVVILEADVTCLNDLSQVHMETTIRVFFWNISSFSLDVSPELQGLLCSQKNTLITGVNAEPATHQVTWQRVKSLLVSSSLQSTTTFKVCILTKQGCEQAHCSGLVFSMLAEAVLFSAHNELKKIQRKLLTYAMCQQKEHSYDYEAIYSSLTITNRIFRWLWSEPQQPRAASISAS